MEKGIGNDETSTGFLQQEIEAVHFGIMHHSCFLFDSGWSTCLESQRCNLVFKTISFDQVIIKKLFSDDVINRGSGFVLL